MKRKNGRWKSAKGKKERKISVIFNKTKTKKEVKN